MIKGIWLQIKFGEIFWGEEKIDALKREGGYKQKGHDYTIFSPSNNSRLSSYCRNTVFLRIIYAPCILPVLCKVI